MVIQLEKHVQGNKELLKPSEFSREKLIGIGKAYNP